LDGPGGGAVTDAALLESVCNERDRMELCCRMEWCRNVAAFSELAQDRRRLDFEMIELIVLLS
jgi:hypothetical protein